MSEMPSSDSFPPDGSVPVDPSPDMASPPMDPGQGPGVPEGAPAPMAPPADPMQSVNDDTGELEARDELELQLMLAAIRMANAVGVAQEGNDPKGAELYASAAQHLTQAAVLLAPQEAIDDAAASGGDTAATQQLWDSTVKGVRRTSGS